MKNFFSLLAGFLPSFLQVPVRRMLGQRIGKGSRIRFGTLLRAGSVDIGNHVSIGPFCYIRAEKLSVGDHSSVKALSMLSTRVVRFGQYVHIAPLSIISSEFTENSLIEMGDHSRTFPYCWMDTGEGIRLGKQCSVGTNTYIYTHGVWSDYLNGSPLTFGPVTIGDNVWLPTKVTILPNVEIGENSIVGTGSLVSKSFGSNLLIAGTPAKVIKENVNQILDPTQKQTRALEILSAFSKYLNFKLNLKSEIRDGALVFEHFKIALDDTQNLKDGDILMLVNKTLSEPELNELSAKGITILNHATKRIKLVRKTPVSINLVPFVRRYGIRLYID